MTDAQNETMLDDAAISRIRTDANSIIGGEKMTQRAAADEANIPAGTFNAFINGSYAGDNARVAAEVAKWLEARRNRKSIKAIVPIAPAFLQTKTAQQIVELLTWAQTLSDFGVIVGSPGTGKTCALEYYRAANPAVFVATMEPAKSSVHHLLSELASTVKASERSAVAIADAVVRRLKDRQALLIVDEAQHLQSAAIDQLRTIHDKARCAVVLVGNESIVAKLGDPERTPQLAQLYSRIGLRLNLPRAANQDVDALLKAWSVEEKDERQFMRLVASKPGALRALTKTLIAATAMAAGNKETRTIAHMRDAWSRVGAGPIGNS